MHWKGIVRRLLLLPRRAPKPPEDYLAVSDEFAGLLLPVLAHTHTRDDLPPGRLEHGMLELEQDGVILHVIDGALLADGNFGELPWDKLDWARRLSYHHLKREGMLEEFGIPIVPAYEE